MVEHTQEFYSKLMIGLVAKVKEDPIDMKTFDSEKLVDGSRNKTIKSMSEKEKAKLKEEIFLRMTHMSSYYDKEVFAKKEILDYLMLKWV